MRDKEVCKKRLKRNGTTNTQRKNRNIHKCLNYISETDHSDDRCEGVLVKYN